MRFRLTLGGPVWPGCPQCVRRGEYRTSYDTLYATLRAENVPVRYVLECLREVYRTDDAARRFKLSDEQRMRLHQRRSQPVMNTLHGWLIEQLAESFLQRGSALA